MCYLNRLLLLWLFSVAGLCAAEPRLRVTYESNSRELAPADLAKLPLVEVDAIDHGQSHRYSGIAVRDLLALVDAPLGAKLRGPALQLVVVVRCRDGYAVVFALTDFDEAFSNRTILLAEKEDNQPLPENAAPFRLIAPGDKKAARWARIVTSLEIVSVGASPAAIKP
jgi:hypothetical protein